MGNQKQKAGRKYRPNPRLERVQLEKREEMKERKN